MEEHAPHARGPNVKLQWSAWASPVPQLVKNLPAMQETWVRSLVGELRSLLSPGEARKKREIGIGDGDGRRLKRIEVREVTRDILLSERNPGGLREGKVLLMLQREKSSGQHERMGDRMERE